MTSFEIKKVYTEHPDVDVIELKDGTFIGINSETIIHYHGELFADDCERILRPNKSKYLAVYNDGVRKSFSVGGIRENFDDQQLENDILCLGVGQSVNWDDGISQSLSVVRTR